MNYVRVDRRVVRYNTNSPCPWEVISPSGKMELGFETKAEAIEYADELNQKPDPPASRPQLPKPRRRKY